MEIFSVINEWLSVDHYEHHQIQALFQLLGIKPTAKFLAFKSDLKAKSPALCALRIALGKEYTAVWRRVSICRVTGACWGIIWSDLCLGARWQSGSVTLSFTRGKRVCIELQPFQLEYPYFLELGSDISIQGPPDLELLMCWPSERANLIEYKDQHRRKFVESLKFIHK